MYLIININICEELTTACPKLLTIKSTSTCGTLTFLFFVTVLKPAASQTLFIDSLTKTTQVQCQ